MRKYLVLAMTAIAALMTASAANAQATQDITINATVASYCTINNITNPTALTATIPVSNGIVNTSLISNTVANVACNNSAQVLATSLSGGVTTGGSPNAGTTNIINYTGAATFGGATSTINTATNPAVGANEAATSALTSSAASGNLVVTITPALPSQLLMPGTYTDTLRVTLTAQ